MYKCTECGLEFENKPDYCDCGNDEFVLTIQDEAEIDTKEPIQENIKSIEPQTVTSEKISVNDIPPSYRVEKEFLKLNINPLAMSVFIICILLSIWIIFVWNPTPVTTEKVSQAVEKVENKAIPSIDKLWKESAPIPQPLKEQTIPVVKKEEPVKKLTTVPLTKASTPVKTAKTPSKPVVKTSTTQNTTTKKTQQAKNTTSEDAAQKAKDEAKKAQEEAAKKALEAKQKAEAEALAAAEKAKKQALAKQELANYKINLRNEIGRKIDFTRVIGDGDCVISFKLDSAGRLVNRAFARQSTNITLNNAVYNAVMATPSYNPPPSAYNNETYHLYIKFANGNFAITLE